MISVPTFIPNLWSCLRRSDGISCAGLKRERRASRQPGSPDALYAPFRMSLDGSTVEESGVLLIEVEILPEQNSFHLAMRSRMKMGMRARMTRVYLYNIESMFYVLHASLPTMK